MLVNVKTLRELVEVPDPAWPELAEMIDRSPASVDRLHAPPGRGEDCLFRLQVTARSTLGAMALHVGALIVDHGWVRLLAGGAPPLPDLAAANGLGDPGDERPPPSSLIVAFDVLGGTFAINGGGLLGEAGEVNYWGPDTLAWSPLGAGYSAFIEWALSGATNDFYRPLRWPGWEEEVARVRADQGLMVYPPPCTAEGRDIAAASRTPVPWSELVDLLKGLAELPQGQEFRVDPAP